MKILIFGLPGSGKSTLAKPFAEMINAVWLNADKIREEANDWDFSPEGRIRQAQRMRNQQTELSSQARLLLQTLYVLQNKPDETLKLTTQCGWTLLNKVNTKIQMRCLNDLIK